MSEQLKQEVDTAEIDRLETETDVDSKTIGQDETELPESKLEDESGNEVKAEDTVYLGKASLAEILTGMADPTEEEIRAAEIENAKPLQLKAYDNLYDLQESEDCVYYSSGARTKQVIQDFFKKWGITIDKYTGPDVAHGVIKEDKKKLGTLVKDILDEAKKKGGGYSVIRSVKGKAQILGIGSNSNIYHFGETENMISVSHKISTSGMVTRVKILGEADDDKRRPVEATVDGQTKYGIRQKIITRAKDDSLDEAKKTAKETLEDDGKPKEEIKVVTVDMPVIRKGDIVHIKMSTGSGYYWVKAITHDCDKMEMTISLKKTKLKSSSSSSSGNKKKTGNFSVGDTVNFHGGTHYVSSDASSGYQVAAGKAKITHSNPGSAHPWCLEGLDWSETHLCGWVDEGTFD